MIYGGFEIKSFEAGKGLWHARIQRADHEPVVIDGISFPALEVGFAWSDQEAAIADAKTLIDQFRQRPGMMPRIGRTPDFAVASAEMAAAMPPCETEPGPPPSPQAAASCPDCNARACRAAHYPRPRSAEYWTMRCTEVRRHPSRYRQGGVAGVARSVGAADICWQPKRRCCQCRHSLRAACLRPFLAAELVPYSGHGEDNPTLPKNPAKLPNPELQIQGPKSKAHRPDVQPIGPALAELLNPAINRGDAGLGSGTGLQPPPDNSWDRRAGGEAAAHRARASTRGTSEDVAKRDASRL